MTTSEKSLKRYCCEPLEWIEGYEEAKSSPEMYEVHHRLEDLGYTNKQLKKENKYYHRPASELILMKVSDHIKHHMTTLGGAKRIAKRGKDNPTYIDLDMSDLVRLNSLGLSYREIGKIMKTDHKNVRRRLKSLGLHKPGGSDSVPNRYNSLRAQGKTITKEQMTDMYSNRHMTIREIVKETGMSTRYVFDKLHEYKIPVRVTSSPSKYKSYYQ